MQIDIIGESQLVGYPTQFPSVSMMDWRTNEPNARFWVLKLIKDNFHPGDALVTTTVQFQPDQDSSKFSISDISAQAFSTPSGHKLLLVNKRNRSFKVLLPDAAAARAFTVDLGSGNGPARQLVLADGQIKLEPFSVTAVIW
jgi:hypothetical protein